MACSFKSVFCVPENNMLGSEKTKGVLGPCSSISFSRSCSESKSRACSVLSADFMGKSLNLIVQKGSGYCSSKTSSNASIHVQATTCTSKALQWWKKNLKPNMIEIHSAQELVNSLLSAGDALVVVNFYSPGCGGCKALHPKICKIAESYPDAIFMKVNYEELKPLCHALNIHVLPFFRIYRGAEGKVSSFSCTIATIKKIKDALARHGNERCSLGPAKGLDDSELQKLASIGEISVNSPWQLPKERKLEDLVIGRHDYSGFLSLENNNIHLMQSAM